VANLPKDVGDSVEKMGKLRVLAQTADAVIDSKDGELPYDELNESNGLSTPNRPVPSRMAQVTAFDRARWRMKSVAQVSEYWPLPRLAKMAEKEMDEILNSSGGGDTAGLTRLISPLHQITSAESQHSLELGHPGPVVGKILLVGSGPGHPSLLTLAAHNALTKRANLILSDKLVPAAILALIPVHTELRIARIFPGNADGAQVEMMEAAVEGALRGLTVVRVVSPVTL